jgi:UDP-N-acetylmuramate dehydrogenase
MKVIADFDLRRYNTFGVSARTRRLVRLESMQDIEQLETASFDPGTDLVIGGGSNLLFTGDITGSVYLNRITGKHIVEDNGDALLLDVFGGEQWHELVLWTLGKGLCGLENLSLIPGLAGAAPMQNIGAYGVEISSLLESVQAFDWKSGEIIRLGHADCGFSYRDSRFKSIDPGRYLIVSCRLKLTRNTSPNISYAGLAEELAAMGISNPDARQVSDAVIRIRKRKLPDPEIIGNAGSFFKNPEIGTNKAEELQSRHASIPVYQVSDATAKLSAAWMIEQCGWKGFRHGDAGVSDQHALVLVNHGNASGMELLKLSQRIENSVFEKFGITLEREPQLSGSNS